MDELFPALIFLIVGVASAISKAQKNQEKKAAEERRKAAVDARVQAAQAKMKAAATQAKPAATPSISFSEVPGQVIAPTVHPHLVPDCDAHDTPGSLGVTSTEGKDPCHEDQLTLERTYDEPAKAEGGLTFNWSGENLVKAFVMQEVLTRPVNRHAR